ncbi:uncharacterized protein LOC135811598 [Sycon ciliatum]|uniref:uncharacterized protein LOC135811598 n=1 Tax=Sycon ciliatum TaxID=27933 RepID=UPI0020AD1324|eukprot:scpid66905/ scgid23063/ 
MPRKGSREQRERREKAAEKRLEDRRRVWSVPLEEEGGTDNMEVVVEVDQAKTGCANEMASQVHITVNEEKSWDAQLYNSCSQWPACGTPNRHCWVEKGHKVELALDGTALHVWKEAMVLFIDGREVETGLTRKQYWRRVFLRKVLISCIFILLGSLGLILYFTTKKSAVSMILLLVPFGLVYLVMSIQAIIRFQSDPVEVSIEPVSKQGPDDVRPLLCAEVESV